MLMQIFKWVSRFEGVTTLMLFLVAMPMKYAFGNDMLIAPFGQLHGAAFVLYIIVMAIAFAVHRIGPMGWLRSFVASLFPFGTFINDPWVERQITTAQKSARA